jgi:hypothetical protein
MSLKLLHFGMSNTSAFRRVRRSDYNDLAHVPQVIRDSSHGHAPRSLELFAYDGSLRSPEMLSSLSPFGLRNKMSARTFAGPSLTCTLARVGGTLAIRITRATLIPKTANFLTSYPEILPNWYRTINLQVDSAREELFARCSLKHFCVLESGYIL